MAFKGPDRILIKNSRFPSQYHHFRQLKLRTELSPIKMHGLYGLLFGSNRFSDNL